VQRGQPWMPLILAANNKTINDKTTIALVNTAEKLISSFYELIKVEVIFAEL
jgi:hypothetical protein